MLQLIRCQTIMQSTFCCHTQLNLNPRVTQLSGHNNCPPAQNQEFGGKISEEKEIPTRYTSTQADYSLPLENVDASLISVAAGLQKAYPDPLLQHCSCQAKNMQITCKLMP